MDAAAAAAPKAVEMVNGIPAPIALALTIAGCIAALVYVVAMIVRDGRHFSKKR